MSRTGRPPKSLQEKHLSGSRIRNDRDEESKVANAAVDLGMPPCPAWVNKEAKKHWDKLGPVLVLKKVYRYQMSLKQLLRLRVALKMKMGKKRS